MNTFRKLIGLFFVLALALPVSAQNNNKRQYMLNITSPNPATINAGAKNAPMEFAVANVSPDGISTIRSFKISVPPNSGIKIKNALPASPAFPSGSVFAGTINVDPNGSYVTVDGIQPPAKPFDPLTGTVKLNLMVDVPCTFTTGDWSANVYTGTPQSGQQFVISTDPKYTSKVTLNVGEACKLTVTRSVNPLNSGTVACFNDTYGSTNAYCTATESNPSYHFTTFSGDCTGATCVLSTAAAPLVTDKTVVANFATNKLTVTAPASVDVNAPFNVTVGYDGPVPTSVALAWTCSPAGAGSLTSTQTSSSPVNFSVTLASPAACKFTATATNYLDGTGNTVAGATGTLGCELDTRKAGTLEDPSALVTYVKASDQGKWGLIRGSNKLVSPECKVVPYLFELDVMSNPQTSKFIVPDPNTGLKQAVSAKYTVVWGRFDVIDDGSNIWASKRPKLSWGIASPVAGTNDFVPALACVLDPDNPDLKPTPYANGFASVPTGDLDKLLPVIPDAEPFNKQHSTTGTTPCPTCIKGNPAYPQYQPGVKAKMCVAQQGWTATGTDYVDGSNVKDPLKVTPTTPITVQLWTSVIDQADGFMNLE